MDSWPKAVIKAFGILAACILALGIGYISALLILRWIFAPANGCEAPCDGGSYLAMGYALLLGPLIGVLLLAGAALLFRNRRRSRLRDILVIERPDPTQ